MKLPNGKTVSMKEKLTGDFVIQVNVFIEDLHRLMDVTFTPLQEACVDGMKSTTQVKIGTRD